MLFKILIYFFGTTADTSEGLVRIVNRETNERSLIKGFSSLIEDISFAHLYDILMLACIEQSGNVYVYVVKEEPYPSQKLKVISAFQINGVCILIFLIIRIKVLCIVVRSNQTN